MRLLLLSTLLGASLTAQAGPPPGYHSPHRYLTPRNVPYRRLPLRLNASLSTGYYNGDISSASQQNKYRVGFGAGLAKGLSPHLTFALDLSSVRLGATDVFPERGLAFQGNNAAGQPTFQYQYVTNPTATTAGQTLTNSYRPDVSTIASRWQMQLGVRYIFN